MCLLTGIKIKVKFKKLNSQNVKLVISILFSIVSYIVIYLAFASLLFILIHLH